MQYISEHPTVLAEKETDGLLVEAFNKQMEGKEQKAKQCVHQALLLQYCRQLGRDGVGIFFKRYELFSLPEWLRQFIAMIADSRT